MSIYIWATELKSLKKWTSDVSEVYVWDTKVRPTAVPWVWKIISISTYYTAYNCWLNFYNSDWTVVHTYQPVIWSSSRNDYRCWWLSWRWWWHQQWKADISLNMNTKQGSAQFKVYNLWDWYTFNYTFTLWDSPIYYLSASNSNMSYTNITTENWKWNYSDAKTLNSEWWVNWSLFFW